MTYVKEIVLKFLYTLFLWSPETLDAITAKTADPSETAALICLSGSTLVA